MATIPARVTINDDGSVTAIWSGFGNADNGQPVDLGVYPHKTVQAFGTFGGATVTVEGSNIASTGAWQAVNSDPAGTAISSTSAFYAKLLGSMRYYRPITAGGSTTALTIAIHASR